MSILLWLEEIVRTSSKACIITSVHPPFDPRIFYKEAQTLVQAGYEVTLIAPHDKKSENVDGVQIMGLPRYKRRFYRPLNWWRILRLALRQKADVYHFHDPELLPIGLWLQWWTGRPVVYDAHEHYPDTILIREWIPSPARKPISSLFNLIELHLGALLSAVAVADDEVEARFQKISPRVVKLYNFPLQHIFRTEQSAEAESFQRPNSVVHVGLLSEERGIWIMLDAISVLINVYNMDVTLMLIGRLSSLTLEKQMKDCVQARNIASYVELVGQVSYTEVPKYNRRARVGWIPWQPVEKHRKNIPTKMFEYMACGLPIVASDLPPIRQFMGDLNCGLLVDPTDPQAHTEAILYLLDHPDEAQRMGENGRRAVEEKYNWESERRKLLTLYEDLLSAR
jgi:glycosyltransferase involved in cell wall biosynthesis